jgi:hypothetical protein
MSDSIKAVPMVKPLRMRALRVVIVLSCMTLIAGCSVDPASSPPAPIIGGQNLGVSEGPRPLAAAPSKKRTALRSVLHHPRAASLKSKRHIVLNKRRRAPVKTAKPTVHHNAPEQETAANARGANSGVVHHIGPKIVPLD